MTNATAISLSIEVAIDMTASPAGLFASTFTSELTTAESTIERAANTSTPATTIANPTDIRVRRRRPGARKIASADSSGTTIVNTTPAAVDADSAFVGAASLAASWVERMDRRADGLRLLADHEDESEPAE